MEYYFNFSSLSFFSL